MNATDLQTFVAVAECRSFSRAAERLHLTQPAITKRIKALESNLAIPLFDRVRKRVDLTEGGRLLLPRAKRLLAEMEDTRRMLENLNEQVSGILNLATSHHIGLHRLAPVLKSFSVRYPEVLLDIRFEDSEAAHDLLRRGHSELAVVTLDPEGTVDLDYLPLWDDPLSFIVARDHPLAGSSPLTLAELAQYPAILPSCRGSLPIPDASWLSCSRSGKLLSARLCPPITWKPSACSRARGLAGACCRDRW